MNSESSNRILKFLGGVQFLSEKGVYRVAYDKNALSLYLSKNCRQVKRIVIIEILRGESLVYDVIFYTKDLTIIDGKPIKNIRNYYLLECINDFISEYE